MTGDYPVFDEGSGLLFCQKFLDHLLFGITIKSAEDFGGAVYAIASLLNLMPLVIAIVFSQFPKTIWSLVTSLVLSLCLSLTYGLLSRAGENYKKSFHGDSKRHTKSPRKCPVVGAIGAVLFPVNKGRGMQALVQIFALLLSTIFFVAVYFGVTERWIGVFVAMLWIPALRGLDSTMNTFMPAQMLECSFTNLFYTACVFIPGIVFLHNTNNNINGDDANSIRWVNIVYALIPPLSFFGILPQFRCLFLYIIDLMCRIVKMPTFGGWSILLFPSILLTVIGTSFFSVIPGFLYVITNIKYNMIRSYTIRIYLRLFLAISTVLVSITLMCLLFLTKLHLQPLSSNIVTMWSSHIKFLIPLGIGFVCYVFFQIGSLFSRNRRIHSRIYAIFNHITGVAILGLGIFDGIVSASSCAQPNNHLSAQPASISNLITITIESQIIHAFSLLHLTISACTDPAALYVSLMLGGLTLTIVQLIVGASSSKFSTLPSELHPNSLPAIAISALTGTIVDGFLHRFIVGINLYISISKFTFEKPHKGWRKAILYLLPIFIPWNLVVLILSSLLNIPPLPIGGTPILIPSYPRYSQFFYSSIGINLTFGDYMKTVISTILDTDGRVKPEDTEDIMFYDSALQSLSGWSQDMRSETSICSLFRSKLNSGALGTQGVILPLLTPVGYGGMRPGDVVLLLSGKNMLLLRSMGMLSFATGVLCNITALETKETSCHTTERVSLEALYNAATRHKFKVKSDVKDKQAREMKANITSSNEEAVEHTNITTHSHTTNRRSAAESTRKFYWLPRYKFSLMTDDYTYQDYSLAGVFSHPDTRQGLADLFLKFIFVFTVTSTNDGLLKAIAKLAKCYDHCFSGSIYKSPYQETINTCLMTHYKDLEEGSNMDVHRRDALKASILLFHCISPHGWEIDELSIYQLFDGTLILRNAFVFTPMVSSNLTAMSHSVITVEELTEKPSSSKHAARSAMPHNRSNKNLLGSNIPTNIQNVNVNIANELAELGLDEEDVSIDLESIVQSRGDTHTEVLGNGSANQVLVSFPLPVLPVKLEDAGPTYHEPLPLASIGVHPFNIDRTSSFGAAYGSTLFNTVLISAFDSTPSPMDSDDQDATKMLAVKAMKHAIEYSIQCISIGDSLPSTLSEAEAAVSEQLAEVYIDQGDRQQWRVALMEKKVQRLFTIKPGPRVYSYSHTKVQWDAYTYPSFACEMIWATIQADLLTFASTDEERFSVQSLPPILRNLFCEAASAPYGYPLRNYGLMEI